MDEVHQRLQARNFARRFACFTLDDGYRDNRDFALPVMREFDAPLTVYVTSDFAEGTGRLWWVALERVIAKASAIEVPIGGVATRLDTSTPAAKQAAFDRCTTGCAHCRANTTCSAKSPRCARAWRRRDAIARELCMSWDELKAFADDPLVTIGAHTITHCNLARQSEETARSNWPPAARGSKRRCSGRCFISPIPMATGSRPARANSRWRRRPDSRPR
jgi:peptidoglycan/xylan/chitin deacetylase (PgdA/CDA1 family)